MKMFDVVQIRNVCWTWGYAEMMIIHGFWAIWLKWSIRLIEIATKWEYALLRWVEKILMRKKREHQFPCMSTVWVEHLLSWDRKLLEREREHQFPCMGTIWVENLLSREEVLLKEEREHQFPCMGTIWVGQLLSWEEELLKWERELRQFQCIDLGSIWIGQPVNIVIIHKEVLLGTKVWARGFLWRIVEII